MRKDLKILVIISSLRKKNTYKTVQEIERIHKAACSCDYEYLFLGEANLGTCLGCHLCLTKGEQYCPLKDDRDDIIAKIESSDAVILASPNHSCNVNWVMKNLIDRLSYLGHRPRFFKQRFMLLITSGSYMGVKDALKALSPAASGGKIVSRLGTMNSPGMNDAKKRSEAKKVHAEAYKFVAAMQRDHRFSVSLLNMLWFSAFKATTRTHPNEFPADYAYYQDRQFFVETPLNVLQRGTMGALTGLFARLIKMGLV